MSFQPATRSEEAPQEELARPGAQSVEVPSGDAQGHSIGTLTDHLVNSQTVPEVGEGRPGNAIENDEPQRYQI